jgi:hypothetical protein
MFLACLPAIHTFAWGAAEERRGFQPRVYQEGDRAIRVSVEMRPYFWCSTGAFVDEPYLRFEVLNAWEVRRGIGVMKSRAIWTLREDIGDWLARHS